MTSAGITIKSSWALIKVSSSEQTIANFLRQPVIDMISSQGSEQAAVNLGLAEIGLQAWLARSCSWSAVEAIRACDALGLNPFTIISAQLSFQNLEQKI